MAELFSPLEIGPLKLPNRIAVAPMCQYSADDGSATDWHLQHLMQLAYSGAGLVVVEATGVERRGRITHGCLGLYSDANEAALDRVLSAARRVALPGTAFGIQLAHAGRKASAQRPWEGGQALTGEQDPWPTVAPSALPFDTGWHTPEALDDAGMDRVEAAFVQAAQRAVRLGFDLLELHGAHGYLIHEFLSPLTNRRTDDYGGSLENRMRFPLRIARAVRAAVPEHVALGARITGTDWVEDGFSVEDAGRFACELRDIGLEFVGVSSGGAVPHVRIPTGPNYQVPLAEQVRQQSGMVTRTVGMIVAPEQAEAIIAEGKADQVALARAFLDDPRWGWHAAEALGVELQLPRQYERAGKALWTGAQLIRH
ncbi:NADH:flavin oxidoreductase/NADH oxidase [Mangrovitalea sediminis]|uniref:NADH:flavin oxidoreductase/NADH oxidase n=1 Tax=Mangrovitalea sediminis TaxID=1982043 RepID=UPI0018E9C37F|nr:NADH:flavin oxidoreductase/NADH oxidase [Mangrovitalea sediminis]